MPAIENKGRTKQKNMNPTLLHSLFPSTHTACIVFSVVDDEMGHSYFIILTNFSSEKKEVLVSALGCKTKTKTKKHSLS